MNIAHRETPPALLDFALEAYARQGVEGACLELQDQYGGQVNLLLWAAWLDSLNAPLERRLLDQAREAIEVQERYWLRPLRRLRRRTPRTYLTLRGWIKRLELRAEYWQLHRLGGYGPLIDRAEARLGVKGGGYGLGYLHSLDVPEEFRDRVLALL